MFQSITKHCQLQIRDRFHHRVLVIDTPGFFDTEMSQEEVTTEITKCTGMAAPGPHVFVLVIAVGRFTSEEQKTIEHFRLIFGDALRNHIIVLFTGKDKLDTDGRSIQDYLDTLPPDLKAFLSDCGNRIVSFDNRAPWASRDKQAEYFIDTVNGIKQDNNNSHYTASLFDDAESAIRMEEDARRKRLEQEFRRNQSNAEMKKKDDLSFLGQHYGSKKLELEARINEIELGGVRDECTGQRVNDDINMLNELDRLKREISALRDEEYKERRRRDSEYENWFEEHLDKYLKLAKDTRNEIKREIQRSDGSGKDVCKRLFALVRPVVLKVVTKLVPIGIAALLTMI